MASSFNELFGLGSHAEDAALEGWWPLQDNAADTVVDDVSSNNNNGTLTGGDNTADKDVVGPNTWLTQGLTFNGTDDYVAITQAIALPFTLLTRMRSPSTTGPRFASSLNESTDGDRQSVLGVNGGDLFTFRARYDGTFAEANGSAQSTNWISLAGVAIATDNRLLFENGVNTGSNTTSRAHPTINTLNIGRAGDSTPSYSEQEVADVSLFSRELTTAEIADWHAGPEPINSVAPAVSGTETEGETLSVTNGTWGLDAPFSAGTNGTITYSYQWTRSDDAIGTGEADIGSATASTYVLQAADVGKFIRCRIRATNDGGFDSAADTNSDFTGAIAAAGGGAFAPIYDIYYRKLLAGAA